MIAIFAAMESEVRVCLPLLGRATHHTDGRFPLVRADGALICQTGLGRFAQEAAEVLLAEIEPRAVLSVGTAGGLAPGLEVGDVIFCERVTHSLEPGSVTGDRDLLDLALAIAGDMGLSAGLGSSVTVDTVAWGPDEKAALRTAAQADITEMESFWIGRAAAERDLPYIAIRAISDDATNRLVEIPGLFDECGRVDTERVLAFTREHPEVIPDLALQHRQGGIALASLARFLQVFLPRLEEALA